MLSKARASRCRSRAGTRERARSARLLSTTFQVMQHGAQSASAAARELLFGLPQGFDLIRLFRGRQVTHGGEIAPHRFSQCMRAGQIVFLADPVELSKLAIELVCTRA
jgi:hypothetical protein